jgi:mono/diheme cytochrome c family protein
MMLMPRITLLASLILVLYAATVRGNPPQDQSPLPPDFVPSGAIIYKHYCAACHGADAKGHGPARAALRVPAPDLTTLSKRHGGKFPRTYVTAILQFGPGVPAHGSANMPTWGPLFEYYYNRESAQRRIQNLCDYLEALQEK